MTYLLLIGCTIVAKIIITIIYHVRSNIAVYCTFFKQAKCKQGLIDT